VSVPDPRMQELLAVFDAEVEERVRALNQLLLRLEREETEGEGRTELFDALFREAHSLKGAARAVGLGQMEELAHALESTLDGGRKSHHTPARSWFDGVFQAVDSFGPLCRSALEGEEAPVEMVGLLASLAVTRAELEAEQSTSPVARGAPPASTPAAPPPSAPSPSGSQADGTAVRVSSESVRVAVGKLDALLAQAGELAITDIRVKQRLSELLDLRQSLDGWRREWRLARGFRGRLRRALAEANPSERGLVRDLEALLRFTEQAEQRTQLLLQRVDEIATHLRHDAAQLALVTDAIEDEVMAVRLLPVATLFAPFERLVRDLSRGQGKEVDLLVEGEDTEIDRKILEQLRDPLMHMIRNAVDHGIESPEQRQAHSKPGTGTIRLAAYQRGGFVEIELEDDGGGIDPQLLRESAVRKGLLTGEQASGMDDRSALELIYHPGFSTRSVVTSTSGRGVGMDVVRENVERLNGHTRIDSVPGRGTRFTISVPLTLATTRAVLIGQGDQLFAVPASAVERSSRVQAHGVASLEGIPAVQIDGHPVPVVELSDLLERTGDGQQSWGGSDWRPYFLLHQGDRRIAFLVDRLVAEQEIVIKSLGWPLRRVRNVSGAAVLGSGQTVVILNPADMLKSAARLLSSGARRRYSAVAAPRAGRQRRRLLVVDDSLTTRTLVRSILEAAGYDTVVASNGVEALRMLRDEPVDMVVTDVDMPAMDGFALTAEIRRDERLSRLPVVLVTSLEGNKHRERGVAVGADAYLVKSGFDQSALLETVGRLL